jgi:hypothetical protein
MSGEALKDLVDFQASRIKALMNRVSLLEDRLTDLQRFGLELCDDECPKEYKRVVKTEILKQK